MKYLATMALLLVASTSVQAQVYVKPQHRVPNSEHGCCGRVVLKTLAQHHGYKMPGYVEKLQAQPYGPYIQHNNGCPAVRSHACWSGDSVLIADAKKHGMKLVKVQGVPQAPAIIGYRPERRCEGGHYVLYVGGGMALDPNNTSRYQPVKWHLWEGHSLILK